MSESRNGIIIGVVILAVIVAFIWYRGNQRPELGACTPLASNSSQTVYYRQGDGSFATYTSPDCTEGSRVTQ
jgi:hypothetical protein